MPFVQNHSFSILIAKFWFNLTFNSSRICYLAFIIVSPFHNSHLSQTSLKYFFHVFLFTPQELFSNCTGHTCQNMHCTHPETKKLENRLDRSTLRSKWTFNVKRCSFESAGSGRCGVVRSARATQWQGLASLSLSLSLTHTLLLGNTCFNFTPFFQHPIPTKCFSLFSLQLVIFSI